MEKLGPQGSVQWLMDRLGKVTASRFKDALGTKAKREGYLWEIVTERVTGNPLDRYVNQAMADGVEREPFARMRYEAATGEIVEEVGFMLHPEHDFAGCSPDGLIGADGGIEIKCPTPKVHLQTILDGMDDDHRPQVQGQMWVTGRKWIDFVSFHPDMPEPLQLYIQRVERDDAYIATLAEAIAKLHAEADAIVARLQPQQQAANESAPLPECAEGASPREVKSADLGSARAAEADPYITPDQCADLEAMCGEFGVTPAALRKAAKVERLAQIRAEDYSRAINWLRKHREAA